MGRAAAAAGMRRGAAAGRGREEAAKTSG